MIQYLVVFFILFFYAHLYLHFLVNPNNECYILTEITKEEIANNVYTKQPFLFDGTSMKKTPCLKKKISEKKYDLYPLLYESTPLLEPYVKFFPSRNVFCCLKKKKWIETNDSCRSFYRIHKGSFHVTCIHPHKKECVKNKKEIKGLKENPDLIQLTLHEDSIVFLPKDWSIYVEPLEVDSMIEKIQYYTPLNVFANSISKILKYIDETISICSMKELPFI
jgi:hypothetical protein